MARSGKGDWEAPVERWLASYLALVERRYGECRAPFAWPPELRRKRLFAWTSYRCRVAAYGERGVEWMSARARTPEALLRAVQGLVEGRFGAMGSPDGDGGLPE